METFMATEIQRIIQRIKSMKRGKGNYVRLIEIEMEKRKRSHFLQNEISQLFGCFQDDMPVVTKVICMKIADIDTLKKEIDHRFNFDFTVSECALENYGKKCEEFVVWLISHLHKKNARNGRMLFSRIAANLSDESLWQIDEAADDPKVAGIVAGIIGKRLILAA